MAPERLTGTLGTLQAQLPDQSTSAYRVEEGTLIEWTAHEGRTYFVQISDEADPLLRWVWAPAIEAGHGQVISYQFGGDSVRGFARLKYIDEVPPAGTTLEQWDADGDGFPNAWEVTHQLSPLDSSGINGSQGDPDLDGLTNLEEFQHETDPLVKDSDHDGLNDGWEIAHGLDPNDDGSTNPDNGSQGDPDGDGSTNGTEQSGNSNPGDAADFPVQLFSVTNQVRGNGTATAGTIRKTPWSTGLEFSKPRGQPITIPLIEGALAQMALPATATAAVTEAPDHVTRTLLHENPAVSGSASFYTFSSGAVGTFTHTRCWLHAPAKASAREFKFLKTTLHSDDSTGKELTGGEIVTLTIPAGQTYSSDFLDLNPTTQAEDQVDHITDFRLLPLEQGPEILDVNSDFDEGRIDPVTGYAIPDCDDSDLALQAVRDHLDGKFKQWENVTEDMHPGWFGVRPKFLDNEIWDGAEITITKANRTDPDTGYPESGQVRFYAQWDTTSEYRGIVPYAFETGAPVNLAAGGIHGATTESVYGPPSALPSDSHFYMEGVHPGKITLEWRLRKGAVDVAFEQTFQVYTRKTALQWRTDLGYKIRLETLNDPSGEVWTEGIPVPAEGYWTRMERACEYYDFYQECFISPLRSNPSGYPHALDWAGLARLAGSQVIGGLSDSEYGRLATGTAEWVLDFVPSSLPIDVSDWALADVHALQQALFMGGRDIFRSVGWQHHAYRSSGFWAISHVATTGDQDAVALRPNWIDLHKGVLSHNKTLIESAAKEITRREQNEIIVPTWAVISSLGAAFVDDIFTVVAKNPCTPHGLDFTDLYPYSLGSPSLSNTANRWTWIDSATPGGILATWNAHPLADRLVLVATPMKLDSIRFASIYAPPTTIGGFETLPILSRDHQDVP